MNPGARSAQKRPLASGVTVPTNTSPGCPRVGAIPGSGWSTSLKRSTGRVTGPWRHVDWAVGAAASGTGKSNVNSPLAHAVGCKTIVPTSVTPPTTGSKKSEVEVRVSPRKTPVAVTSIGPPTVGTSGRVNVPSAAVVLWSPRVSTSASAIGPSAGSVTRPVTVVPGSGMTSITTSDADDSLPP